MKRNYGLFVLLTGLLSFIACSKEKKETEKITAAQLLTKKEWILTGHGFDDNKNGKIDVTENAAADCQKDNTYLFRLNGTGTNFENTVSCNTGAPENHFTWKLVSNDSMIEMDYLQARIVLLNENKLTISPYDSIVFPLNDFLISFRR